MASIFDTIKEASIDLGVYDCNRQGHKWKSFGGRACPVGNYLHSQTAYECEICGDQDYGDTKGPGLQECIDLECEKVQAEYQTFLDDYNNGSISIDEFNYLCDAQAISFHQSLMNGG